MSSPEDIQSQIEQTRQNLSSDVDRLTDKVSPTKVVGRRVDTIKSGATSVKERVMGSTESVRNAGGSVGSAASSITDAASDAPQAIRSQAQGNPLAAGLIAFGVGWLVSSVFPATQPEQNLAQAAQDKATDLAEPLKATAQEVAGNLQEPLQHSVEQIKSTATEGASATAEHAKSAAQDVKEPLQQ
jgi:hypothetical protein